MERRERKMYVKKEEALNSHFLSIGKGLFEN
jgi:hypothetical protein